MKLMTALLLATLALPSPATLSAAQNESDWKLYFTFQNVTFFYAPSTLQRQGTLRVVKWHDSRNPQVVFKVRIDCAARTVQSLAADQYDLITGTYYETTDLSAQPPDGLGTPDSMGSHLANAVC